MSNIPFVRFLFPLIAGIAIARYFPLPLGVVLVLFGILLFLFLCSFIKTKESWYIFIQRWVGMAILCLFLVLGILVFNLSEQKFKPALGLQSMHLQIMDTPQVKSKSIAYQATRLSAPYTSLLLYLPKNSALLSIGSIVSVEAKLQNPSNFNAFDYISYLKCRNIAAIAYLKHENYSLLDEQHFSLLAWAAKCRNYIITKYQQGGIQGQELGTLVALTLGSKSFLDPTLKNAFSRAGAMHVLAVSGLHVGILFAVLSFIFSGFRRLIKQKYLCILLLLLLWAYAFLTGLSASVVRTVIMFSFFTWGKLCYRNLNTFNLIAASAFVMLIANPYFLFDLGFQLSYCAVISIVYFYPKISSLLSIRFEPLNQLWKLTTVSLAAQLGTLPLCLYYFGEFPIYFLVSNAFVILFALLILSLFIFFIFTLIHPPSMEIVGIVLQHLTKILNQGVLSIANWPRAVISSITFSELHIVLYLLIIFAILRWINISRWKQLDNKK